VFYNRTGIVTAQQLKLSFKIFRAILGTFSSLRGPRKQLSFNKDDRYVQNGLDFVAFKRGRNSGDSGL